MQKNYEQEPMRKNRYLVKFPKEFNIESCVIQKCDRPSCKITNGIMSWNQMEIELIDIIGIDVAKNFFDIFNKYLKGKLTNLNMSIEMLDPTGVTVETWNIYIDTLDELNNSFVSYVDDELATTTIKLTPTNCHIK